MIYFITAKDPLESKCVKIGVAVDPIQRLKELQTGNPFELRLIGTMPGSFLTENGLHEIFKQYRLKGEWFKYKGDLQYCLMALTDEGRKHREVTTIHQFVENGLHLKIRQKANRNQKLYKKIEKIRK